MSHRGRLRHGIFLGIQLALCSCTTSRLAPHKQSDGSYLSGAVYGYHDFRQPTTSELILLGESTVALFLDIDLQTANESNANESKWWTLAEWLKKRCSWKCGPGLQKVQKMIGHLPVGAIASGVLVGPEVVAITRHTAIRYKDSLQEFRIVFGFEGQAEELESFKAERICYPTGGAANDYALVRLDVSSHDEDLPAFQSVERSTDAVSKVQEVLAFGHPLGSARVMTGDNDHTYIKDCGEHVRASLDSLEGSSGSPVFIPSTDTEGGWILFGLIYNATGHDVSGCPPDIPVVNAPPKEGFCVNKGDGVGPWIVPLRLIEEDTIAKFSKEKDPSGWCCHSPGDPDTSCDIQARGRP